MGFVVDSSIFLTLERQGEQAPLVTIAQAVSFQPVAIASVTASELLVGVHRADSAVRRLRRERVVEHILTSVEILPFDLEVARLHARISAELLATGRMIGAHDLLIGTTALFHSFGVFTENMRHFQRVPDLVVRQPDW